MLNRLIPDRFILILLGTVAVATLFPTRGQGLEIVSHIANAAIFSLFFFHGLRLEHRAVWEGMANWRLQLGVLGACFVMMPLFGLGASALLPGFISPALMLGLLFLTTLPSTVQAAIASSSMAGGNVAASVVASAISNLSAVILTPLIFAGLAHVGGGTGDLSATGRIATLLLLPFALGQVARFWLADWAARRKAVIARLDRLTIILTVYVAFSAAVNEGLWSQISGAELVRLTLLVCLLLALAFAGSWALGRALGLKREDRISLFFAGAHKSLATGAPMARILFPAASAGMIILPLMIYHQLQLMISAWIAAKWASDDRPT